MAIENDKPAPPTNAAPPAADPPEPAASPALDMDAVNRAITARLERERKAFDKKLEDQKAYYEAKLADRSSPAGEPPVAGAAPGTDGDKVMHKALRDMEARHKAEIAERDAKQKAAEAKQQAAEERQAVESVLRDSGVTNIKGAVAVLKADGRVARDADGNLHFVAQREGYTDEVELSKGLKEWLGSDEGKLYMPPTGAQGSGATGTKRRTGGAAPSKDEQRAQAAADLESWIFGAKK